MVRTCGQGAVGVRDEGVQGLWAQALPVMALTAVLVAVPASGGATAAEARLAAPSAEVTFLDRFVGAWRGTGIQDGKPIRDEMQFAWALNRRFLRFTYKALAGDGYLGEGYVWYNPSLKRYEWWEFNNGTWPVREHRGTRDADSLVMEEKASDRHLRLTFSFTDADTLRMEESHVVGQQIKPYVTVTFRRVRAEER